MPDAADLEAVRPAILIRLSTLINLRWLAILGQTLAILAIAFGFGFPMPWAICLALIGFSALLNLALSQRYKSSHRFRASGIFALLCFDILQLGVLLFLTGGLQNPFSILLMAPVIVSATSLKQSHTIILGAVGVIVSTALVFVHWPLPWHAGEHFELPLMYVGGLWVAILCTIGFTAMYTFRVAEEARKLADALSATELVLQREQHLSALDGLATAAAHELGTPLATIAVVSKEMVNTLSKDSPLREDAQLLRSQADRCRSILQKLSSLSSRGDGIVERIGIDALVEEAVDPLRDFGIDIDVRLDGQKNEQPIITRNPAVLYGLGNIIDNAVDFAEKRVQLLVGWDENKVSISVIDDGPGFEPEMLTRLGDPFLTSRGKTSRSGNPRKHGLGLGLFIAKTLLERSGAEMEFSNMETHDEISGAHINVSWPRAAFEKNPAQANLPPA